MSNYVSWDEPAEVHVAESDQLREVRCPAHCDHGIVLVHGQETDCITCEGYGTVLI